MNVSDDCGYSWKTVYNKTAIELATAPPVSQMFIPGSDQWKKEFVSLDGYAGKQILLNFDATSGFGNNLYIDDILISNTLGINQLKNTPEILIYPNPANQVLTIRSTPGKSFSLALINILGETLMEHGSDAGTIYLDTEGLAEGVYFLSVSSAEGNMTRKVLIKH